MTRDPRLVSLPRDRRAEICGRAEAIYYLALAQNDEIYVAESALAAMIEYSPERQHPRFAAPCGKSHAILAMGCGRRG